ncbi:hypothetical protein D8674_019921 [Pyrus ussuriensis x Pyrus communis]|uniref:Uncharacterized protein n=1 Tax=Pyrus ussuriensis x Pyrus communis TaxID=2448454 RepID=A0A5N5G8X1_9ROSA|nr:hypothetical protein D8674_019921 [Pyrus ussuriensis x Pyrus communis]
MSIGDAIIADDLIDCYKLHKVNSPPPTFNLKVLRSSNNGNPTLEAARVFYAMMSLSDRTGVPFHPGDVYPKSTKELDKGLMSLSNVMSTVAHSDPSLPHHPNASQERKIAYLESELNSI